MSKIIPIQEVKEVVPAEMTMDEKHIKVLEAIMPYARQTPQKNLTEVVITPVTRKSKILFFLLPEWAPNFPPYNLARLVAVAKAAGYHTDAVDLNIKASNEYKTWGIDFDPWHGSKEWRWMGQSYHTHLHRHMQPLLEKYIKKVEEDNIDIVGFSLYYCNQEPTDWMAKQIKERYPHVKIIVGGPQCHAFPPGKDKPFYDYVVSGEGEEILLQVLERIESGENVGQQIIRQQDGQRLDLDAMPKPDYSHFDMSEYRMPNGVNTEFSRGCTAKCVFCSETHFWKYRGRSSSGTLDEVIELHDKHGINFIWFLDSLVNGNLKELRAFCKGVIASGIKINWTGYARCDKRMDLDFYKDLAGSGCKMLSYGIESGSNKVLADMDKRVTVDEIEQNLLHGSMVGVAAHSNWIVGFPTEQYQDFYDSMTLMWRNRKFISVIATGHGFTEPPDTILSQNSEKYGMIKSYYQNNWITGDFKNSKVHRLIRLISLNIMLDLTPSGIDPMSGRQVKFSNIDASKYYSVGFEYASHFAQVPYETYDFEIIRPNINALADSVVNEIWPMLRLLWRARGGYKIKINIDPETAYAEFGDRLGCDLTATYVFEITTAGEWTAHFEFKYKQAENAWRYQDYARETSMSAQRARRLALPESNGEVVWTYATYDKHLAQLEELKKVDFSFAHTFNDRGKWTK